MAPFLTTGAHGVAALVMSPVAMLVKDLLFALSPTVFTTRLSILFDEYNPPLTYAYIGVYQALPMKSIDCLDTTFVREPETDFQPDVDQT